MIIKGTIYKVGERVRIKGIKDPGKKNQDRDLNGRVGYLAHRYRDIPFGDVGVLLDRIGREDKPLRVNILAHEFEVVEGK